MERRGPMIAAPDSPGRCVAVTAKGDRCRKAAARGEDRCPIHLGAPVGRPTVFSERSRDVLLALLRAGVPQYVAAELAGVRPGTLKGWLARGRREQAGPFAELARDVDRAAAEAEVRAIRLIGRSRDWRAQAWLLSVVRPERYGPDALRRRRG